MIEVHAQDSQKHPRPPSLWSPVVVSNRRCLAPRESSVVTRRKEAANISGISRNSLAPIRTPCRKADRS
jgi:hypothetical protein